MRRLFRWTFNFWAVASALLCVGVCALWVRSYLTVDAVQIGGYEYSVGSDSGILTVGHFGPPIIWMRNQGSFQRIWSFHVPYPLAALSLFLLPAWWVHDNDRRRRYARGGLCPGCGYDLRATPKAPKEGGILLDRCPECGSIPKRA